LTEGRPSNTASIEAVSQIDAAEQFGVYRSTVQRAASVLLHDDSDLIEAVESGDIAVSLAAKAVRTAPALRSYQRGQSRIVGGNAGLSQ
jgi:hypothetical protein